MPHSKPPSSKPMLFRPHADQKEIITAALDQAMKKTGSNVKTVALEAICQSYMATGIAFKQWDDALNYAVKQAADKAVFVANVIAQLEALCPELTITACIEPKAEAAASMKQSAPQAAAQL
jgi:hypothetical protein